MNKRPTSVTIISWFLIVTSLITVITSVVNISNPDVKAIMQLSVIPLEVQYLIMAIGLIISISCGLLMLAGKSFGRNLYVGWTILSIAISLFTSPLKTLLIPGIIFFIVIAFFLYRPKANQYFSDSKAVTK